LDVQANKATLLLGEEVDSDLVQIVVNEGYAHDLTDDELEQIGRDPFLIAYWGESQRSSNTHVSALVQHLGVKF